ncbi:PAS domain-containing protein [Pseudophaeobacter sp.]|uniref:hybrid sensor histidine kinase/response regulator n=1 Tax=Pseudophaeobacter sp. TaxID=1971739 RepID=UPI003298FE48
MGNYKHDPIFGKIVELARGELITAIDRSNIGLWLWDIDNDIIETSQGMLRLTGFDTLPGMTRGEVLSWLLHPDDIERTRDATRRLFDSGESYETLCRMRHASGRYSWALTRGTLVHDGNGKPTHLIGVVRVLDDLERVKKDLFRSEEIARLGNWSVDTGTGELEWSQGAFTQLGFEPFSFAPTLDFARSLYPPEERLKIEQIIEQALETKEPFEYQTRIQRDGQPEKHFRFRGAVETGITGEAVGYYGTLQDISDEIERDNQIRQAQKLESIGKLTGGVAHDFNNLLAVILGNLELLQEEHRGVGGEDFIESAIEATLRGAGLTRNMLSFARRAELEPTQQDINSVVRHTKNWIARTLREDILIETSLLAGLWSTEVDQNSLESALLNLILNARDAMPDGGSLTIETANMRIEEEYIQTRHEDIEPGRYVMLAVSDTGEGIHQDNLSSVFDPFFTTKQAGKGSGMGLSMVQGFVKQSGGSIQVYSELGLGTTFKLYFKACETDGSRPKIEPETENDAAANRGKTRILLVEDEAEVLSILQAILRSVGFCVVTATSGDEALKIFKKDTEFDLLMTDIVMPGSLKGTALATELRRLKKELPVVFLSGYANEATVHGNGLRPRDIRLMKPVSRKDLLRSVDKALNLRDK